MTPGNGISRSQKIEVLSTRDLTYADNISHAALLHITPKGPQKPNKSTVKIILNNMNFT